MYDEYVRHDLMYDFALNAEIVTPTTSLGAPVEMAGQARHGAPDLNSSSSQLSRTALPFDEHRCPSQNRHNDLKIMFTIVNQSKCHT